MLNKIMVLLIAIICLVSTFIFFLYSGIKIDSISFSQVSVSNLYIKFDKKLIVDIEQVKYESKKSTVKNSTEDLKANIQKLPILLDYFQEIHIESLKIDDNEFTILFDKESLYLDNKFVNISAKMDIHSKTVNLDLYSIYLKDIDLLLKGKVKIDLFKEVATYFGSYFYKNIEGELNIQATKDFLDFYVNTNEVKNIKFVRDFVRLPTEAEAWMYDNVEGRMKLNYMYGKLKTDTFEPVMSSLKGNAIIHDAKIRFHKDVQVVDTKKLIIDYIDDKLIFKLEKPEYNKTKIYGSGVVINNLTSEQKGEVVVSLKTKSALNDDILEILKAYKINLPLIQTKGISNSEVTLSIPYLIEKGVDAVGKFNVTDAIMKLKNFEFFAKKAKVELKDSTVIIKDSLVKHKDMIDGLLNLTIDTKTSTAKGNVLLKRLFIKNEKEPILDAKNLKSKIKVDFSDKTLLVFDDIKTKIDIRKKDMIIDIADLSILYPHSKLLKDLDIKKGDISLDVFDENNIKFKAFVDDLNYPLYKGYKQIKTLSLIGEIAGKNVKLNSLDNELNIAIYNNKTPQIDLKNIDVKIDTTNKKGMITSKQKIDAKLENAKVTIDKDEYYVTKGKVNLDEEKVKFKADFINLDLPFTVKDKPVTTMSLDGSYTYKTNSLKAVSKDKKLDLELKNNKEFFVKIDGFDFQYDTNSTGKYELDRIYVLAKNSNIIVNKKYKLLAKKFMLDSSVAQKLFLLENGKLKIDYKKDKNGNITLDAKNLNDSFINTAFDKELVEGGEINLTAKGRDNTISGKAIFSENKIKNLAVLTNIITLINTSPAIINPLLAIPSVVGMASSGGFAVTAYKVNDGYVDFTYNFDSKQLELSKIATIGNGIDFDGEASIDLNNGTIDSNIHLIFFKGYSTIVGAIPVVNYIILGDKKRVDTQITVSGSLLNPEVKTNVTKDSISAPVNVIKRIILSPIKLLESIVD